MLLPCLVKDTLWYQSRLFSGLLWAYNILTKKPYFMMMQRLERTGPVGLKATCATITCSIVIMVSSLSKYVEMHNTAQQYCGMCKVAAVLIIGVMYFADSWTGLSDSQIGLETTFYN